ncbi:N-acetylmuramoyl-L-alanine amidase [Acuticoccus sp.]|uniref:N-acetylmuramoyl-L-alanine amidase n=1 Tax=Acuticoccus sp. TaxID=1904378 RepID=UPI003B51A2B8
MIEVPSPNHGPRVGVDGPDMVVLHYTDMADAGAAVRWLCDPRSQVSAHYLVMRCGEVVRMVDEARRAWHAGVSAWEGVRDVNSRAIGIELDSPGHRPQAPTFPEAQLTALERLLDTVRSRWPIAARNVVAHSDVAPARKRDPGERFPWTRLAQRGHALAVRGPFAGMTGPLSLGEALTACGYGIEPDQREEGLAATVTAFHRRHLPHRVGAPADGETLAAANALAALVEADRRASPAQRRCRSLRSCVEG